MNPVDPPHDGDIAAFYDTNAGSVYTYCLSLCADSEIADNAFHRAMSRAWAAGGGQARAFAVARTECRMRGLRVPTPAVDDSDGDARALARIFTRLPPRDAEVAELSLRHGLDAVGVAEVVGVPYDHAGRLVADARDLFTDALTAEHHVGVAEAAILGELVRSPHPLARVAGLMPPREPSAELRARVVATAASGDRRQVPTVIRPRPAVRTRRTTRRMVTRSAAIACSVIMVAGFLTALSRPSGVATLPEPVARRTLAAPPPPSPPVRIVPTRPHRPVPPVHRAARPSAAPRPTASRTPGPSRTPGHHLSGRGHDGSTRDDFHDELVRMYKQWRAHQRRFGGDPHRHHRTYQRREAPRDRYAFHDRP